jgi:serine O-acetyltransferase
MSVYFKDLAANNWKDPFIFMAISVYRFGHWIYYMVKIPLVRQLLWICYRILDAIFLRICCHAQIPAQCHIGAGMHLPHGFNTIIIHQDAIIGERVTLFHAVTIGGRNHLGTPEIGDRVFIGAGAKILGPVKIGHDASIGANAVVVKDVPAQSTAIGVPAKNIFRDHE